MARFMLAAVCLIVLSIGSAGAADIESFKSSDGRSNVLIFGAIQPGDDEKFATVAGAISDDASVWLDSPGGSLAAGLRIGTAIRLRTWKTVVPDDATCASACGLIWLGGVSRTVGQLARVGFHAAFVVADGRKQEIGSANALVGSYLNRLGLTDAAVIYLTSAPPDGAAWLTEATARQVDIRAEFGSFSIPERLALASPKQATPHQEPSTMPEVAPNSPTPGALLAELYREFPWSVRLGDQTCIGRPCKVRLVAADEWTENDGVERRIVIGAAEVQHDCHVCTAIMGIGVFRLEASTWRKESVNPAVTSFGSYGVFQGKVSFLDGHALGRAVMIEESDLSQGESNTSATLLLLAGSNYVSVLSIPIMHDGSGNCMTTEQECRRRHAVEDYTSVLSTQTGDDGSLRIIQTFTAANPIPPAVWVVTKGGVVKQIRGQASLGSVVQQRASLNGTGFDQGHTDRIQFEAWFKGLQGDAKAGAESWASRRSLRAPGLCEPPAGQSADWSAGCTLAREKLLLSDRRRKSNPDYRRGWNSL